MDKEYGTVDTNLIFIPFIFIILHVNVLRCSWMSFSLLDQLQLSTEIHDSEITMDDDG